MRRAFGNRAAAQCLSAAERSISFCKPWKPVPQSDLGGLLRDLSAAKILRAPLCIPYRADSWEPCLLAHGVSSPEAMKDLHAKALRYETFAGCAPPAKGRLVRMQSRAHLVTAGFPLADSPAKASSRLPRLYSDRSLSRKRSHKFPARFIFQGGRSHPFARWNLLAAHGG